MAMEKIISIMLIASVLDEQFLGEIYRKNKHKKEMNSHHIPAVNPSCYIYIIYTYTYM